MNGLHPERLGQDGQRRGTPALLAVLLCLCAALAGFVALGAWQVQRLHWKHALIERVESRIHAPAVDAPAAAGWPDVAVDSHEYLRVRVEGEYLPGPDTRVQALTELGTGWWLLAPLRTRAGDLVMVNRGFVPADAVDQAAPPPAGMVKVEGLLRINEPDGRVLRRNQPGAGRWYSRDVAAIALQRGLGEVAPYFIDADPAAGVQWPRGGMTVVKFRDNHLQYALTWFGMALLTAFAIWKLLSSERRLRQHGGNPAADAPPDAAGNERPRN